MTKYKKLIEELAERDCGDFSFLNEKKYLKFSQRCWEVIRREEKEPLESLSSALGLEKMAALTKYFHDQYPEYYAMSYFRNDAIDIEVRKALLDKIYQNSIIANDYSYLEDVIRGKVDQRALDELIAGLRDMTFFCANYNRKGTYLTEILVEMYDLDAELGEGIAKSFDENKLSLKLDFLIAMMRKKNET